MRAMLQSGLRGGGDVCAWLLQTLSEGITSESTTRSLTDAWRLEIIVGENTAEVRDRFDARGLLTECVLDPFAWGQRGGGIDTNNGTSSFLSAVLELGHEDACVEVAGLLQSTDSIHGTRAADYGTRDTPCDVSAETVLGTQGGSSDVNSTYATEWSGRAIGQNTMRRLGELCWTHPRLFLLASRLQHPGIFQVCAWALTVHLQTMAPTNGTKTSRDVEQMRRAMEHTLSQVLTELM